MGRAESRVGVGATDDTGYTQTVNQAPPEPNGASGYPLATVTVRS